MENENSAKNHKYLCVGVVFTVFSLLMLASLHGVKYEGAFFPALVLGFMALMGCGMIVDSFIKRGKAADPVESVTFADVSGGILWPGGLLLATSLLLSHLGFYVSCFLLVIALFVLQSKVTYGKADLSGRRIAFVVTFAFVLIVFMYIMFNTLLHLPTPRGIFGF